MCKSDDEYRVCTSNTAAVNFSSDLPGTAVRTLHVQGVLLYILVRSHLGRMNPIACILHVSLFLCTCTFAHSSCVLCLLYLVLLLFSLNILPSAVLNGNIGSVQTLILIRIKTYISV